jgi:phosphoserine phosphatase RsbU/P
LERSINATFEEETLQLKPGDTLVVFSDGVAEALNPDGREFSDDQLLSCVQASRGLSAAGLLKRILATVDEFSAGVPQRDDLTVLVLRFTGGS